MKFKLKNGEIQKFDTLPKNYRTIFSYLHTNDHDLDEADQVYLIYDDNNLEMGSFEVSIAPSKPVINIRRMKMHFKDLQVQEEIIKNFVHYLWNYNNTEHLLLNIQIDVLGSGMDSSSLVHLGFCDEGCENKVFSLLHPDYLEIVEAFADDSKVTEELTNYYQKYQSKTKERMKKRLTDALQTAYGGGRSFSFFSAAKAIKTGNSLL